MTDLFEKYPGLRLAASLQPHDFVPAPAARSYGCQTVIWCLPELVDAAWAVSTGPSYISPTGENATPGRFERLAVFLQERTEPVHMPYAAIRGSYYDELYILNGCHRTRTLINAGGLVPLTVPYWDRDYFEKHFCVDTSSKES